MNLICSLRNILFSLIELFFTFSVYYFLLGIFFNLIPFILIHIGSPSSDLHTVHFWDSNGIAFPDFLLSPTYFAFPDLYWVLAFPQSEYPLLLFFILFCLTLRLTTHWLNGSYSHILAIIADSHLIRVFFTLCFHIIRVLADYYFCTE